MLQIMGKWTPVLFPSNFNPIYELAENEVFRFFNDRLTGAAVVQTSDQRIHYIIVREYYSQCFRNIATIVFEHI